jgi:secreted PhoX family phosphatase
MLCVNHEYVDQRVLHANGPTIMPNGQRPADKVRREIAAHGVSVVEIRKDAFNADGSGDWLALDINDPHFVAAAQAAGVEFKDQAMCS